MGGYIEDWLENLIDNIPGLEDLKGNRGEKIVFSSHLFSMAFIGTLAALLGTYCKWALLLSLIPVVLTCIAEWGPKGRRIDWISRGAGSVIGLVLSIIVLIWS
jgi:hypothetical protein|tara:strand:- start:228 stop:536 length:309 start_codon:yes stop_codon:yes gene_type:complete